MKMKINFISAFIITALLCLSPAMAQVPLPEAAPAPMSPLPKPAWLVYKTPYIEKKNSSDSPNHTNEEIIAWAEQTVAEVLSFGPENYKDKLKDFKKYFVPQGWKLYVNYLESSKLIDLVTDDGFTIGAIVNNPPEIVSHAATDGVYHWIVRMPVTTSYFSTDANGNIRTEITGKYTLFMDVARVTEDKNDDDIVINNWRMDQEDENPESKSRN